MKYINQSVSQSVSVSFSLSPSLSKSDIFYAIVKKIILYYDILKDSIFFRIVMYECILLLIIVILLICILIYNLFNTTLTSSVHDNSFQTMPSYNTNTTTPQNILPALQPNILSPPPSNVTPHPSIPQSASLLYSEFTSSYPIQPFNPHYYPALSEFRSISPSYTLTSPWITSSISSSLHSSDIFYSDSE